MDLKWANPAACGRVSEWEVLTEDIFSDHLYIIMDVTIGGAGGDRLFGSGRTEGSSERRRWSFLRLAATHRNEDIMTAAALTVAWAEESPMDEETEARAARLRRDLQAI
jgi:hypothetical protein